jgi:hypothetical protein
VASRVLTSPSLLVTLTAPSGISPYTASGSSAASTLAGLGSVQLSSPPSAFSMPPQSSSSPTDTDQVPSP